MAFWPNSRYENTIFEIKIFCCIDKKKVSSIIYNYPLFRFITKNFFVYVYYHSKKFSFFYYKSNHFSINKKIHYFQILLLHASNWVKMAFSRALTKNISKIGKWHDNLRKFQFLSFLQIIYFQFSLNWAKHCVVEEI